MTVGRPTDTQILFDNHIDHVEQDEHSKKTVSDTNECSILFG